MATFTPNLNLYKPDSTDNFEDFRAEFNNNMDILDNGGGGGGGGDTVVLGMYIDTDRIITSGTYSSNFSYTATEDCYLCLQVIANANDSAVVTIDSETVANEWSSATHTSPIILPVRKGQIVGATSSNPSTAYYFVYGVKQGTKGIFAPVIYSDNERVIGVWRDNKPLYQKTWDLGSDITVNANSWTNTAILVSDFNIENIVNVGCVNSGGTIWDFVGANCGQTYVQLLQTRNTAITVRYVTLWYTKTTDSAGSGNWNTDGIPTVHYSTSEQVIGTWIDGKPIYQRVITGLSIGQNSGTVYTIPIPSPDLEQIIDSTLMSTLTQYKSMTHPPTWITNPSNLAIRSQEADTYDTFIIAYTKTTD